MAVSKTPRKNAGKPAGPKKNAASAPKQQGMNKAGVKAASPLGTKIVGVVPKSKPVLGIRIHVTGVKSDASVIVRRSRRPTTYPESYAGKWIAWSPDGRKVIASGSTAGRVQSLALKAGCTEPILERVPRNLEPSSGDAGS